jgi:hypothetical protein
MEKYSTGWIERSACLDNGLEGPSVIAFFGGRCLGRVLEARINSADFLSTTAFTDHLGKHINSGQTGHAWYVPTPLVLDIRRTTDARYSDRCSRRAMGRRGQG